jgi:hypothetical protein
VRAEDLRALASRSWADERSRGNYWAERYSREGSAPARRAALALFEHARRVNSAIFGDRYRADDLAHHHRLREQLDRAARALTGR